VSKLQTFIVCVASSYLLVSPAVAYPQKLGPLRFLQPWSPHGIKLNAKIFSQSAETEWGVFRIMKDGQTLFEFDPKVLYPQSMTVLDSGNLAVQWREGIGSINHLFVYAFINGKVRQVLNAECNGLHPEFAYPTEAHIMGRLRKNGRVDGGPFFEQRIINPHTDWISSGAGRKTELSPVSADIYTWDDRSGKYNVRTSVPWGERLGHL
jgi:hypothetical protein